MPVMIKACLTKAGTSTMIIMEPNRTLAIILQNGQCLSYVVLFAQSIKSIFINFFGMKLVKYIIFLHSGKTMTKKGYDKDLQNHKWWRETG